MKPFLSPGQASCLSAVSRILTMIVLIAAGFVCLRKAHDEVAARQSFALDMARVQIIPPDTVPELNQDSIDIALVMYGIQLPSDVEHPRLDLELHDRGLTTRGAFMEKSVVTIGPAAFSSWALLGSTLGHEIEVHCAQNMLFITVLDALHLDGTGEAERQAYIHELRNAKRFGLDVTDADLIASTMEYYYPDRVSGKISAPVVNMKRWLARNFLAGSAPL